MANPRQIRMGNMVIRRAIKTRKSKNKVLVKSRGKMFTRSLGLSLDESLPRHPLKGPKAKRTQK